MAQAAAVLRTAQETTGSALSAEQFVWLIGNLCKIHRLPFDAALVLQQFPPPHDRAQLVDAVRAFGFRVGVTSLGARKLNGAPLPLVAFLRPISAEGEAAQAAAPGLILRHKGERILYVEAGNEAPRTHLVRNFEEFFEPEVILVSHEGAADEPVRGFEEKKAPFGFRWFLPELAKHRVIWRDVLIASLALQLVGLATPLFTQVVIDKVVVHHTESTLIAVAVGLSIFLVFNALMSWMRQYLVIHTGIRVDAVLGSQVLAHLFRLPLPYFEHRATGITVARLQGIETIREFVTGAAVAFLLDAPFLVIFLAVMFWYSWQLSLIAVTVLVVIAALSAFVTPVLRERLNRQFMLGARNQAFLTEYVAGAETVKSLQFEPSLERRYGDYLAGYLAAGFSTRSLANTYNTLVNALEQAMTIGILLMGALLVMKGEGFTIGMLVAFQMFASRMAQPMLRIAGLWQEFQQANIAVKRLGDIMDAPAEPYALGPSRATVVKAGAIDAQGLAFRYSERHPYLYRDLSFSIDPGTLVVVTGPSGCGKSTLAKMLLGFYQPSDGRILLDGRDLQQLSANELRAAFGVVPQETTLFSGTVYDNLSMANPHAGFDEIVEACRQAEIHDVIEGLPQGYRTLLGEHGVGLSGGQKQRLAIARALLKRPRILIFDEATSGLDAATAESFARTVNRLKGAATIVFIAHQLPRGLEVDEVVRLGDQSCV